MSLTSDVIDGLLTLSQTVLPTYRSQDGYTPLESLDGGTLSRTPALMIYNPTMTSASLEYQQNTETIGVSLLFVRVQDNIGQNGLALRNDTELMRLNIDSDANLDSLTDQILVISWEHFEEGENHVTAGMIVEAIKVQN